MSPGEHLALGFGILLSGLALTVFTLAGAMQSPTGGTYVILIGLIAGGCAEILYGLERWINARNPLEKAPLELQVAVQSLIQASAVYSSLDDLAVRRIVVQLKNIFGRRFRPALVRLTARNAGMFLPTWQRWLAANEANLSPAFKAALLNGSAALVSGAGKTEGQRFLETLKQSLNIAE
jgi:hypothetical protein